MSRSPLAYPLARSVDGDSGGAADLHTDVMRFMAILALCLVAIFALVQSIPMAPETVIDSPIDEPIEMIAVTVEPLAPTPEPEPVLTRPKQTPPPRPGPAPHLTRPKWVPKPKVIEPVAQGFTPPVEQVSELPDSVRTNASATPQTPEPDGFTLRFASDLALTRLVAAGQVGFYAIDTGRARRMSVRESRISFWDASTPASFHEMESQTVPRQVVQALARTGVDTSRVNWGVTLPNRLQRQLDTLMRENRGGHLVIHPDGQLRLEAS